MDLLPELVRAQLVPLLVAATAHVEHVWPPPPGTMKNRSAASALRPASVTMSLPAADVSNLIYDPVLEGLVVTDTPSLGLGFG